MALQINSFQYSVVLVGAMNPAIHHPKWYELIGMFSADEAQNALRGGTLVVVPQLVQFKAAGLDIQCTPNRWQISTADQQQRNRIINIAATTFERLGETPVSAYGLNARFNVTTGSDRVLEILKSRFSEPPVDLSFEGIHPDFDSLAVSYKMSDIEVKEQPLVQRQLTAMIARASHGPPAVIVTFNMNHSIVVGREFSRFDLDKLLRPSAVAFEKENAWLEQIIGGLIEPKE